MFDLEWLKSVESIEDYFYTEPEESSRYYGDKNIEIYIYINKSDFNEEDLHFYYNCFEGIANELVEKMKDEKSSIDDYSIKIRLHVFEQEEFDNIKNLSSNEVYILYLWKWIANIKWYRYSMNISIEDGEIEKYKISYENFKELS